MKTGILTYWDLDTTFDRRKAHAGLVDLDLRSYIAVPSPTVSLRVALRELFISPFTVRSRPGKDGYTVVNSAPTTVLDVRVAGDDLVFVIDPDQAEPEVRKRWTAALSTLHNEELAKTLMRLIREELDGVSLRDFGVAYWIPPWRTRTWDRVARVVQSAVPSSSARQIRSWTAVLDKRGTASLGAGVLGEVTARTAAWVGKCVSREWGYLYYLARREDSKALRQWVMRIQELFPPHRPLTDSLLQIQTFDEFLVKIIERRFPHVVGKFL